METTPERILEAAWELLLSQGIKKTSLDEVAHRAGVTRITVYRYYPDKKQLIAAALMRVPAVLEAAQAGLVEQSSSQIEAVLDQIGAQFAALPAGDFPALLEELERVYPDVWRQVHTARANAMEGIFNHLFALAEKQGRLRPDLNRPVVQAYFSGAVIHVLENPALVAQGLPAAEIFHTVKDIFLYGILKHSIPD